jgi:hypothetical protein
MHVHSERRPTWPSTWTATPRSTSSTRVTVWPRRMSAVCLSAGPPSAGTPLSSASTTCAFRWWCKSERHFGGMQIIQPLDSG